MPDAAEARIAQSRRGRAEPTAFRFRGQGGRDGGSGGVRCVRAGLDSCAFRWVLWCRMSVSVSACEADPEASPGSPSRKTKPKEAAKASMEERRLQGVFICQAKAFNSIPNVPAGNIAAFSGVDQYMLKRNTMSADRRGGRALREQAAGRIGTDPSTSP